MGERIGVIEKDPRIPELQILGDNYKSFKDRVGGHMTFVEKEIKDIHETVRGASLISPIASSSSGGAIQGRIFLSHIFVCMAAWTVTNHCFIT